MGRLKLLLPGGKCALLSCSLRILMVLPDMACWRVSKKSSETHHIYFCGPARGGRQGRQAGEETGRQTGPETGRPDR